MHRRNVLLIAENIIVRSFLFLILSTKNMDVSEGGHKWWYRGKQSYRLIGGTQ